MELIRMLGLMRLRRVAPICLAALAILSMSCCGGNGTTFTPTPVISSLSPDEAIAGGPSFTLSVAGTGFMTTSQVFWNGSCVTAPPPSTTCATAAFNVSTQQLSVSVPAAYIASTGFPQITVVNPFPGGPSLVAATFTISAANNPVPMITSLSPSNTPVGQLPSNSLITVNGTNFIATSAVSFNGNPRATQFISASQLTATVLASDVATGGSINVKVSNPSPGGGVSGTATFTVGPVPAAVSRKTLLSDVQISPELISVSASGGPENGESAEPAVSADGRFVAFYSKATNLVANGSSGNIFVRDTCIGVLGCTPRTVAADLNVNGNAPGVPSNEQLAISADGRFVAFASWAPNLVVGSDTAGQAGGAKVYLRDLCAGDNAPAGCVPQTQLVSVDPMGAPVSGAFPAASSDGRFVAFVAAPAAAPTATATQSPRLYVRDTCAGPTANSKCEPATISIDLNGSAPAAAAPLAVSGDGRYVAATIVGSFSVANATVSSSAILLADTCVGADTPAGCIAKTISVSVADDGSPLPGRNSDPSLSNDGRFITFESDNSSSGDLSAAQIYLRDTCLGSTSPSGCTPSTSLIASGAAEPFISGSGRYITYVAGQNAADASGTTAGALYVFDTCFGGTLPCTPATSPVTDASVQVSLGAPMNADGSVTAFASKNAIAALPSSGLGDVYVVPTSH